MRRSRFTDNEILHLLYEASTGVSAAEICRTAHISLRTLYRWRRRFGSLNEPAVLQMKELAAENARLRGLVSNLRDRLRDADAVTGAGRAQRGSHAQATAGDSQRGEEMRRRRDGTLRIAPGQSLTTTTMMSASRAVRWQRHHPQGACVVCLGSHNVKNDRMKIAMASNCSARRFFRQANDNLLSVARSLCHTW